MQRQTSIQLKESTKRQVADLKAAGFGNLTDIIDKAIDRMHQREITVNTRPNRNAGESKFHLGDSVISDTGFEGVITSVLPRLETFFRGEWISDREYAYKVQTRDGIFTVTESELSAT